MLIVAKRLIKAFTCSKRLGLNPINMLSTWGLHCTTDIIGAVIFIYFFFTPVYFKMVLYFHQNISFVGAELDKAPPSPPKSAFQEMTPESGHSVSQMCAGSDQRLRSALCNQISVTSSCEQRRLWSACTYLQASLSAHAILYRSSAHLPN